MQGTALRKARRPDTSTELEPEIQKGDVAGKLDRSQVLENSVSLARDPGFTQ